MYTDLQIEAIKLFGRKDLTEGCIVEYEGFYAKINDEGYAKDFERYITEEDVNHEISLNTACTYNLLGHIPHLEDLHRMMNEKFHYGWEQISKVRKESDSPYNQDRIIIHLLSSSTVKMDGSHFKYIPYDSNLPLLDQPSLPEIISLFK